MHGSTQYPFRGSVAGFSDDAATDRADHALERRLCQQPGYQRQPRLYGERLNQYTQTNTNVSFDYDANGNRLDRLSSLAHTFATTTGNVGFTYGYNPGSQMETRTRDNDAYAWNAGAEVNRPYSVNGLNQYTAAGSAAFVYDRNGNLTGDGTNTYTYDVENRLVAASGAQTIALRYDPLGRLYETVVASGTRRMIWDGDALVTEYNETGALAASYVHGTASGDDPLS